MKKISLALFCICMFALPALASAHALPVASAPSSSQVLDAAPQMVTITFSEHVDASASSIKVTDASGALVSGTSHVDAANTHALDVPINASGDGTYIVSWSVVSSDDGHFTRGAYPFAVGKNETIAASAASNDVEIVEISTAPEAFASAVELLGHGFLWAALLLFAFAIRPLITTGRFDAEAPRIRRGYAWFVSVAVLLAFSGGAAQILIKATQLAGLQSLSLSTALTTYLGTSAGSATMYRMIAVAAFLAIFFFGRRAILYAKRVTWYEIALALVLMVFAFMRAKISHATSNPFYPDLSILVNFFHVIEKDIWSGILAILLLLVMRKDMRRFLDALIPNAFRMLAIDFGAVSVTAVYIVWLHLKSFSNLFSTQWGSAFLELLLMAVLLVIMRSYHVFARLYRPRAFSRALAATLAIEFAFAVMVVYASSVVIITSPPLSPPPAKVFSAHDQGQTIVLTQDPHRDGQLLLTVGAGAKMPTVTVQDTSAGAAALAVEVTQQFSDGYTFPQALLAGSGPFTVSVTAPQSHGYDAHAVFTIDRSDLSIVSNGKGDRSFDPFTLTMISLALAVLLAAYLIYRLSGVSAPAGMVPHRQIPGFNTAIAFVLAFFAATTAVGSLHGSALENPFAAECIADGNEWHIMLPTVAGAPTAQTPAEGCMWGMGNYMYMFPDRREYEYNKSFPEADVSLSTAPEQLVAGTPAVLTLSLKENDGAPAKLFIDMDKIVHTVIVSKDETVYAHIHPDDARALTQSEIDSSTFTLDYTFPKSGDYIVMVDYAHGIALESKQFVVHVAGGNPQMTDIKQYPTSGVFDGYTISLDYVPPQAGEITTVRYTITKDGKPVELVPYLSAAMHVSIVKNDFSWHAHVHGEVHAPGSPVPPLIVKNGQIIHSMALMVTPDTFNWPVEAHFILPSSGLYTIWGQFKTASGDLVVSAFTMRVQ